MATVFWPSSVYTLCRINFDLFFLFISMTTKTAHNVHNLIQKRVKRVIYFGRFKNRYYFLLENRNGLNLHLTIAVKSCFYAYIYYTNAQIFIFLLIVQESRQNHTEILCLFKFGCDHESDRSKCTSIYPHSYTDHGVYGCQTD